MADIVILTMGVVVTYRMQDMKDNKQSDKPLLLQDNIYYLSSGYIEVTEIKLVLGKFTMV